MKKRNTCTIAILIMLSLGILIGAQGFQGMASCDGPSCGCTAKAAHQMKSDLTRFSPSGCRVMGSCCRIQGNPVFHDLAVIRAAEFGGRSPISLHAFAVTEPENSKVAINPARTVYRWPMGATVPIYYQTLSILC